MVVRTMRRRTFLGVALASVAGVPLGPRVRGPSPSQPAAAYDIRTGPPRRRPPPARPPPAAARPPPAARPPAARRPPPPPARRPPAARRPPPPPRHLTALPSVLTIVSQARPCRGITWGSRVWRVPSRSPSPALAPRESADPTMTRRLFAGATRRVAERRALMATMREHDEAMRDRRVDARARGGDQPGAVARRGGLPVLPLSSNRRFAAPQDGAASRRAQRLLSWRGWATQQA